MRSILHSTSFAVARSTQAVRTHFTLGFVTFLLLMMGLSANAQSQEGCNPEFFELICPDNAELDCTESTAPENTGMPGLLYDEFCQEIPEVTFSDFQISDEGECPVVIQRDWMATYFDHLEMCTPVSTLKNPTLSLLLKS